MTPIQTNKPVFFGEDGEVLKNGTIYIGQPNTDPRTNPKTVTFQDSAGSQFPAPQKLETNEDGRISYNGKPIIALVDGEYSSIAFNAEGKQVDYTPSNTPVSGGGDPEGFDELIRVGLTLDEVKTFDVAVGDVVQNVGETVATDGNGASWLAVSNTGNPGDDVDLIDFDNGLQGRLITSKPDYQEESVEVDGDFSAGQFLKVVRHGSMVVITSVEGFFSHSASANPSTSAGIIPEWARPSGGQTWNNYYYLSSTDSLYYAKVLSDGTFELAYYNSTTGIASSSTTSGVRPNISYVI